MIRTSFLSLTVLSQCIVVTQAWGTLGHEIVGNLAWHRLSDDAQSWVKQVLHQKEGDEHKHPDPTMTPLGGVADWADQVRHYLGWSAPLHFIDVRDDLIEGGCLTTETTDDCRFQYQRDCHDDVCAAGAILNYTKQLLAPSRSNILRGGTLQKGYNQTQALMFLTHFVGDIHQPLHASRKSDKGGNDFHVHFSLPDTIASDNEDDEEFQKVQKHHKSWNLHSVWDTAIIEVVLGRKYNHSRYLMEEDLLQSLQYTFSSPDLSIHSNACNVGLNVTCVLAWGEESFALALKYAYVESDNVTQVKSGSTLEEVYYESRLPIIKQQLILGGVRLAETIEAIVAAKDQSKESPSFAESSKVLEVWKTLRLASLR